MTRRNVLRGMAVAAVHGSAAARGLGVANADLPIIDTHQHLWDLSSQRLPWLEGAAPVLNKSYRLAEYAEATAGLNVVGAIYMEVDVAPDRHVDEADRVLALCNVEGSPTRGAVIGGRPASAGFAAYLARFRDRPEVKGVRQVLHGGQTPPGFCLGAEFVKGVKALGDAGLSFDLCLRPGELDDGVSLVKACPGTRFVLDHCGNADPNAFGPRASGVRPSHDPDAWRRAIGRLAALENVSCKISGVVAKAPANFKPDDLAPIVNHCLDRFGPDRVVFGGDWPVCLLGSTYRGWVEALRAIVSNRPEADRRKLWRDNALRVYRVNA